MNRLKRWLIGPHLVYVKKNVIEGAGCSHTQSEDTCYACEQEGKRPCPYTRKDFPKLGGEP